MAFPIPPHLPKKQPTDVSSAILGRISDADSRSLNAALAESWITDLDESIRAAKVSLRISPRHPRSFNWFTATYPRKNSKRPSLIQLPTRGSRVDSLSPPRSQGQHLQAFRGDFQPRGVSTQLGLGTFTFKAILHLVRSHAEPYPSVNATLTTSPVHP